jgi:hypothetical protein
MISIPIENRAFVIHGLLHCFLDQYRIERMGSDEDIERVKTGEVFAPERNRSDDKHTNRNITARINSSKERLYYVNVVRIGP